MNEQDTSTSDFDKPTTPSGPPEEPSWKPVAGIIIIVVILALGGYYVWQTEVRDYLTAPEETAPEDAVQTELETQSDSDALSDIEADLEATDLEMIDAELDAIEADLNADLQSN